MLANLQSFLTLNGKIDSSLTDTIISLIFINDENSLIIKSFYDSNFIDKITDISGSYIDIDSLSEIKDDNVICHFIPSELKKIHFYITVIDFISSNRFNLPESYYIYELNYNSLTNSPNPIIEKISVVTKFFNTINEKAKFNSSSPIFTVYLFHEKTYLELQIDNVYYEFSINDDVIKEIGLYTEDLSLNNEKSIICIKELIDFLSNVDCSMRTQHLLSNFSDLFNRSTISYEYYISNFSYNKVKIELDNSALEYSKNIRSIINDSQSKLIAIPAAMALAVTSLDLTESFTLNNLMIIFSSILFSYLISIFIKNQKSALEIINDNILSFKSNHFYKTSDSLSDSNIKPLLKEFISKSYSKIDKELDDQRKRLQIISIINWTIPVILLVILFFNNSNIISSLLSIFKTIILKAILSALTSVLYLTQNLHLTQHQIHPL